MNTVVASSALAKIKARKTEEQYKAEAACRQASSLASMGYIESAMNSLRSSAYHSGKEEGFMIAAMIIMEEAEKQ